MLAASFGGRDGIAPARVVSLREFAGSWEYLIDGAIYTAPAHSHWSGAALITRDGKLVGVGSLIVGDASGSGGGAGNLYVPTDILKPILGDLIANGAVGGAPKPWIGLSTQVTDCGLVIARVTPEFSGREGRAAQGRPDHQYRRRYAEDASGFLPQALVAGRRRDHRAARHPARRQGSAYRRAID